MPALDLYAPDKARYSRWMLGVSSMLLTGYGAYSLFYAAPSGWREPIGGWEPLGDAFPVSPALLLGLLVVIVGAGGTWWAINYPKLVDFMKDVEAEMAKVSWASKSEVVTSSFVVVVATAILSGWVYLADLMLAGVRQLLGGMGG